MQVNAVQSEMNSLHRVYNNCLMTSVDNWMGMAPAEKKDAFSKGTNQFCVEEK